MTALPCFDGDPEDALRGCGCRFIPPSTFVSGGGKENSFGGLTGANGGKRITVIVTGFTSVVPSACVEFISSNLKIMYSDQITAYEL